jgi:hypothetical protein
MGRGALGIGGGAAVNDRTSEPRAMRVRLSVRGRELLGVEVLEILVAGIGPHELVIDRPARQLVRLPCLATLPPA